MIFYLSVNWLSDNVTLCSLGHKYHVCLLIQKGADIRKRYTPTGSTLLHTAAQMGRGEVMDYLLGLCRPLKKSEEEYKLGYFHRGLDINAVNKENKTALQVAAEKGEELYN